MTDLQKTLEELRARRQQGSQRLLRRGTLPTVTFHNEVTWRGGWIFLGTALVVFIISAMVYFSHNDAPFAVLEKATTTGILTGLGMMLLYYVWPVLHIVLATLWYRRLPERAILNQFSHGQNFACLSLAALALLLLCSEIILLCQGIPFSQTLQWSELSQPLRNLGWLYSALIWLILVLILMFLLPELLPQQRKERISSQKSLKTNFKAPRSLDPTQTTTIPFSLWLGRSTGLLSRLWHEASLAPRQDIVLNLEEAAQNILVLGGIGAGKTTRLMQPLLAQLLDQHCGGLLFDVKGDVKKAVLQLATELKRPFTLIGPNQTHINLLAGLTPEIAASFLKSAFLLSSKQVEGFWIETATELCRNTLGMLSFLPDHYTLHALYNFLFDEEFKEQIQQELGPLFLTLPEADKRRLKTYQRYQETIFATFDEKIKSGVKATIAQALSPFNHPDLIDAFCQNNTPSTQTELTETAEQSKATDIQSILDGNLLLVDLPLSQWGLGAKVAYTFIKLRFFNLMQSRIHHPNWNQDQPVFFMCDEYQELISANKDGLSDLNFWDKSRSSKTIGIISAQSISSFYAALSDHDLAHAILQNFRQKMCFRTEDLATLTLMDKLAGQAKIQKKTTSRTTGNSSRKFTEPTSSHKSDTQSITETRESVLDATLFRNLSQNQAVALLSIQGRSMDDVLELSPVFL